jgi:hypothetical protein
VRILSPKPADAAEDLYVCARREAAELSFAVGVEHLVLATAVLGTTLAEFGVTADDIRERIRADERDALASLGISLESVRGEIEERFGNGAWSTHGCLPVAPDAKRVLELASRRRRRVSADQLLAALIQHSAKARRLLFELDVPVGTLQDRLRR